MIFPPSTPDLARSRPSDGHSSFQRFSFDAVHAFCGYAGFLGVRYRSLGVQHFSFSRSPLSPATPFSPPSGPAQRLFQGPPAKSKFLAAKSKFLAAVAIFGIWPDRGHAQGNVGIGTTSPAAKLHVVGSGEILRIDGTSPFLAFYNGGTYRGYVWSNSSQMEFGTAAGSTQELVLATGGGTDRLKIAPTGLVTIGGDLSLSGGVDGGTDGNLSINDRLGIDGTPTAKLEIFQGEQTVGSGLRFNDGTNNEVWDITHGFGLRFHYGGVLRGFISATTGAYTTSSDETLKSNILALPSVLSRVEKIRPSCYVYKSDPEQREAIGLVAQQAMQVFPELVHYSKTDKLYSVDYSGFSVVAIKAIQEQQVIIKSQTSRIESLEREMTELKALVSRVINSAENEKP